MKGLESGAQFQRRGGHQQGVGYSYEVLLNSKDDTLKDKAGLGDL